MLSEEKIRLMTKLARYEQKEKNRYMKISRYYRSDYIGLCLVKNFFATTFAYVLILALAVFYRFEVILSELNDLYVQPMITKAVQWYIVLVFLYSCIAYIGASVRYIKAQKSMESYDELLKQLEKTYGVESSGDQDALQKTENNQNKEKQGGQK